MDAFDYADDKVDPPRDISAFVWNILTILVLLLALGLAALIALLYLNPAAGFNPFPPPTLPALIALPTSTPTPRNVLPATWTPTVTQVPTSTPTPEPTATASPVPTQLINTTPAGDSTPAPAAGMPYILQPGSPIAIPNIGHPDQGCDWMGVAGQATGLNNAPVVGLLVQLGGVLDGQTLNPITMTGTATQYGMGGFEFELGDQPQVTRDSLWVQLLNQDGSPLSDKVFFETYAECDKNLVLINFNQVR